MLVPFIGGYIVVGSINVTIAMMVCILLLYDLILQKIMTTCSGYELFFSFERYDNTDDVLLGFYGVMTTVVIYWLYLLHDAALVVFLSLVRYMYCLMFLCMDH